MNHRTGTQRSGRSWDGVTGASRAASVLTTTHPPLTPRRNPISECYAPDTTDTNDAQTPEFDVSRQADLDGDGYYETNLLDSNEDGELDTVLVDIQGDRYVDIAAFDNTPGDGTFVADVIALGFDGDGLADVVLDDTDLDGIFETVIDGGDEVLANANPYEIAIVVAPTA
ncbi:hypothetical protein GCM10017691_37490 [Pseudonocardia petroleophila]